MGVKIFLSNRNSIRALEDRMVRKMFGQRGLEINEARSDGIKKIHNHYSPNITTIFKLKRKRWTGHLTHTRQNSRVYRVLVGNLKKEEVINHRRRWGHNVTVNFRAG
jgi:hypothetical protein